ncbi:MAG TPA: hypothetical protein VFP60_06305 [Pseudolabrys sp.]|nr:hypothetical protein [Pseudolabrys sp.]
MPHFGLSHREFEAQSRQAMKVNWRRGLFRVWLLLSAAWIMGWVVYLLVYGIRAGFQSSNELLAIPVLLIGPPIALMLFGLVAGWAFRGFKPDPAADENPSADRNHAVNVQTRREFRWSNDR